MDLNDANIKSSYDENVDKIVDGNTKKTISTYFNENPNIQQEVKDRHAESRKITPDKLKISLLFSDNTDKNTEYKLSDDILNKPSTTEPKTKIIEDKLEDGYSYKLYNFPIKNNDKPDSDIKMVDQAKTALIYVFGEFIKKELKDNEVASPGDIAKMKEDADRRVNEATNSLKIAEPQNNNLDARIKTKEGDLNIKEEKLIAVKTNIESNEYLNKTNLGKESELTQATDKNTQNKTKLNEQIASLSSELEEKTQELIEKKTEYIKNEIKIDENEISQADLKADNAKTEYNKIQAENAKIGAANEQIEKNKAENALKIKTLKDAAKTTMNTFVDELDKYKKDTITDLKPKTSTGNTEFPESIVNDLKQELKTLKVNYKPGGDDYNISTKTDSKQAIEVAVNEYNKNINSIVNIIQKGVKDNNYDIADVNTKFTELLNKQITCEFDPKKANDIRKSTNAIEESNINTFVGKLTSLQTTTGSKGYSLNYTLGLKLNENDYKNPTDINTPLKSYSQKRVTDIYKNEIKRIFNTYSKIYNDFYNKKLSDDQIKKVKTLISQLETNTISTDDSDLSTYLQNIKNGYNGINDSVNQFIKDIQNYIIG
jgi:hypothetical protein